MKRLLILIPAVAALVAAASAAPVWNAPQPLNPNAFSVGHNAHLALASDRKGSLLAVWDTEGGGDLLFTTSDNDGLSWGQVDFLKTNSGAEIRYGHPAVVSLGKNRWAVTWQERADDNLATSGLLMASATIDNGVNWSPPVALSTFAATPASNRLAALPNGVVISVWDAYTDAGNQVLWARSADGGLSFGPAEIFPGGGASANPHIVATGTSSFLVICQGQVAFRSVDSGETWSGPNVVPIPDATIRSLASHGQTVVAAFEAYKDDPNGGGSGAITVGRSPDGGITWGPETIVSHGNSTYRVASLQWLGGKRWGLVTPNSFPIMTFYIREVRYYESANDGVSWAPEAYQPGTSANAAINENHSEEHPGAVLVAGKKTVVAGWVEPIGGRKIVHAVKARKQPTNLAVTWLTQPALECESPGCGITGTVTIANGAFSARDLRVSFYISHDEYVGNDQLLASSDIKKLKKDQQTTVSFSSPTVPNPGNRIFAVVDSTYSIRETIEKDNTASSERWP